MNLPECKNKTDINEQMIGILKETPAAIQIREVLSYNNKKQRVEHFLKDGKTISMKLPFQRIKRRIK